MMSLNISLLASPIDSHIGFSKGFVEWYIQYWWWACLFTMHTYIVSKVIVGKLIVTVTVTVCPSEEVQEVIVRELTDY